MSAEKQIVVSRIQLRHDLQVIVRAILFEGNWFIDIRECFERDGAYHHSKTGIRLPMRHAALLLNGIEDAIALSEVKHATS
jgi:hypothetical protein